MEKSKSASSQKFAGFFTDATAQAPVLLSCQQTKDAINAISLACSSNCCLSKALFMTVLPDCTLPSFSNTKEEQQFLTDTLWCALRADSTDGLEMITDIQCFKTCGNSNTSLMQKFWDKAEEVLEKENGSGAHSWQHSSADNETSNRVLFAPGII
eukprot:6291769-Ditylum_brightwellii.AAC.1